VGVFLFFGLFLIISGVLATSIFNDDFEAYTPGDLDGQGNWTHNFQGYYHAVSTERPFTGDQSVKVDVPNGAYSGYQYNFGGTATSGSEIVNVYLPSGQGHNVQFYYALYTSEANDLFNIFGFNYEFATDEWKASYDTTGYIWTQFGDPLTSDNWHSLKIDWDFIAPNRGFILTIDGGTPTETLGFFTALNSYNYADKWRSYGYGEGLHYEDDYGYTAPPPLTCADYHSAFPCVASPTLDCDWSPNFIPPDFGTCTATPPPPCGVFFACPNCLTEGECNDQAGCTWSATPPPGACAMGFIQPCGVGLRLGWCLTEGTCTAKGGYWYSDHCFANPKPSYFITFADYYDDYGDYDEPSSFVLSLSGPADNLFNKIGGFVANFELFFDRNVAYAQAKNFGSAIPKARSYLTVLDSFAGNLPVGEAFIFIIVFMLAVGLFRVLSKLFALIKIW
jgi:hypothetical protein